MFKTQKCSSIEWLNSNEFERELFTKIGYTSRQNKSLCLEKYKPVSFLVLLSKNGFFNKFVLFLVFSLLVNKKSELSLTLFKFANLGLKNDFKDLRFLSYK